VEGVFLMMRRSFLRLLAGAATSPFSSKPENVLHVGRQTGMSYLGAIAATEFAVAYAAPPYPEAPTMGAIMAAVEALRAAGVPTSDRGEYSLILPPQDSAFAEANFGWPDWHEGLLANLYRVPAASQVVVLHGDDSEPEVESR
jgi:hypothetical protein